jgi:DNA-binding NarL/FixJ family response regulator
MNNEVRILIADDHPIVRRGLRQVIESDAGLKVVAEAEDGEAALAMIEEAKPQIAVLDIDMPKLDGFGVARGILRKRFPIEIIFITIHAEEDLFNEAMDLGAKGYLLKESAVTDIVKGIRAVAAGEHFISSRLTAYLLSRRGRAERLAGQTPLLSDLTPTELRILKMIAEYKTSKEIAEELFISYRTVENHRTNICRKLDLHGSNALLKFAIKNLGRGQWSGAGGQGGKGIL